jgi:hypothetical protein
MNSLLMVLFMDECRRCSKEADKDTIFCSFHRKWHNEYQKQWSKKEENEKGKG